MFVTLTKEEFEALLPANAVALEWPEVQAKEYVYELDTKNPDIFVRVYSTVDIRTNTTRDYGKDAIRIVFWDSKNGRPIGKGKKVLRVEGATSIKDRIKSRINEFLDSAHEQQVIDFDYVKAILSSDTAQRSNFGKSLLEGLNRYGSLTDKQLAYVLGAENPRGFPTFEAKVKIQEPEFLNSYLETIEEGADDEPQESTTTEESTETEEETQGAVAADESVLESEESRNESSVEPQNSGTSSVELIPTTEYPAFKYPFETFNPVQSATMPHRESDINMVIGANTSAGKTICAELIIDWILEHGA